MKISLNWIQDESNVDIKGLGIDEILRRIGSQLGAVEDVEDISVRYQGIVIAEVVSCEKHPNADRLNVCKLNDNGLTQDIERDENGLVQVVCGAPNVRAGLKVAWLPPGSTVPSSIPDDPFVLGVRELRGVMSNGMIASPHELAISDYHSGILELDDEAEVGRDFAEFYGLNDTVIDLENKMFTHRPDCFGILGVARELAGITGQKFQSPSWYQGVESNFDVPLSDLPLEAKCETDLVSRFTARVVEGVTVGSSAVRVQSMLTRVGVKPINNIVDLTNYYMYLTAQPTHAFDYDKVKALSSGHPTIFPRMAVQGEKLTLLGGKEITLDQGDIVIATDRQPIALAGIMGGADTEVDENTKNIIVECATFDMYSIRRSSMRHGLFTDASNRFNKGQSPYQNLRVLHKLTNDIAIQTGTKLGEVIDIINCQLAEPNDANVVK
ncbi:phenylalanine--tRNA ligase subunit beta, partial [Candidatus Saccharibacteria bacterium]|nr:phenylalanine--tRNA ligase subunit beta [Candidatus Saccharibacteria bacterium]